MRKENKIFVQIGTNNGADEFNTIVKSVSPSKVILVEPNASLNNQIFENYKGVKNVFVENVAITEKSKGMVKLVIPKNHYDHNGRRIGKTNYIDVHYSLLPMDDWGNDFNEINILSMTFAELCKKHRITDIDYLQIDTEGYDAEIIKSIDFAKINIDTIKYEDWSFPVSCFTRYGEKAAKYGVNGMNDVDSLLKSLGYIISKVSNNFLAIKV